MRVNLKENNLREDQEIMQNIRIHDIEGFVADVVYNMHDLNGNITKEYIIL